MGTRILSMSVVGVGLFGLLAGASRAAPANDDWAGRTVVGALPFTTTVPAIETATSEAADPTIFCLGTGRPTRGFRSVWYEFTTGATDDYINIAATGYDTMVGVYEGSPTDGFSIVRGGCNDDGLDTGGGSELVGLRLRANTRYSIVVAGYGRNQTPPLSLSFRIRRSTVHTVTKTQDTNDGTCDADCSLREAVAIADSTPGAIVLPAGTYVVPGGLSATKGGAIYGAGMAQTVIDAAGSGRVITHDDNLIKTTYALHDLTLTNGNAVGQGNRDAGGAFLGTFSYYAFDRVVIRDSTAVDGGGLGFPWFAASASVYDSVIGGNTATTGGGIWFGGSNIDVRSSSIVGNESGADGGGFYSEALNDVLLLDATLSGNAAGRGAGGAYFGSGSQDMRIVVNNSTIVNNTMGVNPPTTQNGGVEFSSAPTPATDPAIVTNTIISGNRSLQNPAQILDCGRSSGYFVGTVYNFVQAPHGCTFAGAGDVTGIDPQLRPLTVGLPVPVHVPAMNSPVVDAGDPGSSCESLDARRVVRPVDGDGDGTARCDIGAVEQIGNDVIETIFANGFE